MAKNIKTSANKDPEVKFKARRLIHLLDENEEKYTIVNYDKDWDEAIKAHGAAKEAIGGFQLVRKNGVDIPFGSAESGPSSYLDNGRYAVY